MAINPVFRQVPEAEPQQNARGKSCKQVKVKDSHISNSDSPFDLDFPFFVAGLADSGLEILEDSRKMAENLNCTFVPASTATDAGVAGAGVSSLHEPGKNSMT